MIELWIFLAVAGGWFVYSRLRPPYKRPLTHGERVVQHMQWNLLDLEERKSLREMELHALEYADCFYEARIDELKGEIRRLEDRTETLEAEVGREEARYGIVDFACKAEEKYLLARAQKRREKYVSRMGASHSMKQATGRGRSVLIAEARAEARENNAALAVIARRRAETKSELASLTSHVLLDESDQRRRAKLEFDEMRLEADEGFLERANRILAYECGEEVLRQSNGVETSSRTELDSQTE